MKAVLDASVAIKTALAEPDSPQARALIADYVSGLHEFIAPDTFPVEIAHGLTRAERRSLAKDADVSDVLFSDVMASCPSLYPCIPILGRAVEIARKHRVGVYDCLYVSLAEQEGCELLTADQKLINALRATFQFIIDFKTI